MSNYTSIEKKWQKYWDEHESFKAKDFDDTRKHFYLLVEFPYPSGAGLHVGHVRSYTSQDVRARMMRMQGYNVLFPMGFDAFGAPAEQYAIKTHQHPKDVVKKNIETFKNQMKECGFSFDWSRSFATTDPDYYKWTQWQFIQFFKHGMAYKTNTLVNWCPKCKMVLSNEDAAGGVCERCGTRVEQKEKSQWMLKMASYAESLLDGLKDTNFQDKVKLGQINWIGKSEGVEVKVEIDGGGEFSIFTTCIETIYGITFFVIAPDGKIIKDIMPRVTNKDEVNKYIEETSLKNNMDRTELNKDKSGVEVKGVKAINPVTGERVPIYLGDFVLGDYGTGAVMAVPAHDSRDYEFAKEHNLPIIKVIDGKSYNEDKAYTKEEYLKEDAHLVNSSKFDGLSIKDAKEKIIEYLEEKGIAKRTCNYKMRDWVFGRQRFWGEPIPMINCPHCGWVPVPDEDLPVLLPDVHEYEPTDNGESPLAKISSFVNCKCPKCGADAKRETDTMPQWAGSSWYFLRYMDPHNSHEFASMKNMKYWDRVDFYDGGNEHTARHLLYARFWVQFLYNIGLVPKSEMIWTRVNHGMILGPDGSKMSKSKGNVINPDDIVRDYGADTLRTYEMFMGDYQMDAPWNTDALRGCYKFIGRVERLGNKLNKNKGYTDKVLTNKTIKKVTDDINNLKFNTAISALMIMVNEYEKMDSISLDDYKVLLYLFNPFAPHITEELNEKYNLGKPICESTWPEYDEELTIDKKLNIAVQVNGKVRATISIDKDEDESSVLDKALKEDNVIKFTKDKEIIKKIYVKGRIVNIVVK